MPSRTIAPSRCMSGPVLSWTQRFTSVPVFLSYLAMVVLSDRVEEARVHRDALRRLRDDELGDRCKGGLGSEEGRRDDGGHHRADERGKRITNWILQLSERAVLRRLCDVVRRAERQRLDRHRRVVAAAGDERAAVDDEEVRHVVRAVVLVRRPRSSGRCPCGRSRDCARCRARRSPDRPRPSSRRPPAGRRAAFCRKNSMFLMSSGWLCDVIRMAGRPHASFTSGSRSTRLVGKRQLRHETT